MIASGQRESKISKISGRPWRKGTQTKVGIIHEEWQWKVTERWAEVRIERGYSKSSSWTGRDHKKPE